MRILLTNWTLANVNGSITHLIALHDEFIRRGHEVEVWTLRPGMMSKYVRNIPTLDGRKYDLALVNQNNCLQEVVRQKVASRVICTIHGTKHSYEQPEPGADLYVAVSERVQDHLRQRGFDSVVIYNSVDLTRFSCHMPPRARLQRVGFHSKHFRALPMLQEACRLAGCEFKHIIGTLQVASAINTCDAIAAIGRSAIEAIACGRPVLILDHPIANAPPRTDGWFSPQMAAASARYNYTGWYRNIVPTVESIVEYLRQYDPTDDVKNREYAMRHHNIVDAAARYLELAK